MLRFASGRRGRIRSGAAAPLAGDSGFTLIELMVVVALIAVLAGMGVVQYRNSVVRTKEAVLREDLFRMRDAIDQYYADKAKYPASLETLVSEGYLRQVPRDPITNATDTWQAVPSEPDPANPEAEAGIFDVKSGSEGTSLDGSRYAEW
jgi:general secretion pathway protein G